jgi:molecular chaperone GrpE
VLSLALRSIPEHYSSPPTPDLDEHQTSTKNASEKTPDVLLRELYKGVSLTNKQLLSTFGKYGITQFDPTGQKFDPNLHEAMYAVPLPPDKKPGSVIETRKFGYMLKERVLRAAQVGIVQEK